MDLDTLTDPETLRDREGVTYEEREAENEGHYHAYVDHAGTVVVGVTDGDGQIALLEHPEHGGLAPSYTRVEAGEDYLAAAREVAVDSTGLEPRLERVLRVRRHTYRTGDGAATTGHDVVLLARTVGDGEIDPEAGHEWTPSWYDAAVDPGVGGKIGEDIATLTDAVRRAQ